jgi:hypothetical protein
MALRNNTNVQIKEEFDDGDMVEIDEYYDDQDSVEMKEYEHSDLKEFEVKNLWEGNVHTGAITVYPQSLITDLLNRRRPIKPDH